MATLEKALSYSVGELARLLDRETWRVRHAVDCLTGGACPRVGGIRSVPARLVPRIRSLLKRQDREREARK